MRAIDLVLAAVVSCVSGCLVESAPEPAPIAGDGLLTVDFTVDGTTDPSECDFQGAASVDVLVMTPSGAAYADVTGSCRAGVLTVALPPGNYSANAVLLDRSGYVITTPAQLGAFTVYGDDELIVYADFPPSSFL
jgi:hypothetical protein